MDPMYRSDGIVLHSNMSLVESMDFVNKPYSNIMAHIRVNILGECHTRPGNELDSIENARNTLGIQCVYSARIRKYIIGYIDILLIKGSYSIPNSFKDKSKDIKSFEGLTKSLDELEICLDSIQIAKYVYKRKLLNKHYNDMNIAIVNRVYINPHFRRLGINTWIHQNLTAIVNSFGMVYPDITVLTYGDFSNEAGCYFNMSNDQYRSMLENLYKRYGYKELSMIDRKLSGVRMQDILFKYNSGSSNYSE